MLSQVCTTAELNFKTPCPFHVPFSCPFDSPISVLFANLPEFDIACACCEQLLAFAQVATRTAM